MVGIRKKISISNRLQRLEMFAYKECLFTNIQKQQNMLKISLLFKKYINFTGK